MDNNNQVSVEEAYKIAQQHHQAGNLTLADRTYRDILNTLPEDFTSLHYLGIIAYQRGVPEEGVDLMQKAVNINADNHETWNAYGVMLSQIGRREEAIEKWEKALDISPDFPDALSNMGNALWALKRFEEAYNACKKAIDINPDYLGAYVNIGNALTGLGRIEEAIEYWDKAIEKDPKYPFAYVNIGNAYRDLGRIKEAEEYSRKALKIQPDNPDALLNLGNALRDQGQFKEAEECYRKSSAVRPSHADTHNNLALLLIDTFRYEEAITAAKYAIAFDANHADAYGNLAFSLKEIGKLQEAEEAARQSLKIDPQSIESMIDLADILYLSDRLSEAETLFNDVAEQKPNAARIYIKLSAVLEKANRMDEAIEALGKAAELSPEMPDIYHQQALIYLMSNQLDLALKAVDKTLELNPELPPALATKSEILQSQGDMDKARDVVMRALDKSDRFPFVYLTLSKVTKFEKNDPIIEKMETLLEESATLGKTQTALLHYALHKAYSDSKQYDKAFEHLKHGSDTKRSTVVFDSKIQERGYQQIKERFSKESLSDMKDNGSDTDVPIFIVGMPRSGTTLTEQIISSHPDVYGAGELLTLSQVDRDLGDLTPENSKAFGNEYVKRIRAIDADSAKAVKITDKMPSNYTRVGQIFVTMPNAKIIHCRRNPVDTCLSCYKQLFARGQYWSYNLDELAEHYALYEDMMQHWRDVLPAGSFLEIDYEETVSDFENQARRLLDFVEMEWDDACLTPHKTKRPVLTASKGQVRQPIYKTSVEAWRRYEKQLQPLADKLKPFIKK